uniref:F-box/FBD/LRR-repeat protein At5g53840-like isoform X1 n=1 Tax=Erigeron canadensis TaxID=72917 RepID=UPI001CB8A16B|nr:F-box/FBD/LRR-repeat protein At5g53840-like isoform X1 [Erigeron canadensis]
MMDRGMNLEGDDRLSSLPEDLIYKILSYNGIKRAIKPSTLASKWRYMWTAMPFLDFSSEDFSTLTKFSAFVANVLSLRDNQAQVYSIKLRFVGDVSQDFVKQIMDYAFSHNIQRLDVTCLLEDHSVELPLSLFGSQSLKHLSLKRDFIVRWGESENFLFSYDLTTTSTWELPALTSLCLGDLTLCDDSTDKHSGLFSKYLNLKNLTLRGCKFIGSSGLCIWHPLLADLTIYSVHGNKNFFIVVALQLKNLNIGGYWKLQYLVSAPELASLRFSGGARTKDRRDVCRSEKLPLR